jgi:hypothetical protein
MVAVGRAACLLVCMLLGCGPMIVPDENADESTTSGTSGSDATDETGSPPSLGGCTLPTSAQESDDGGLDEHECTPIAWTPIEEPAFTSNTGCDGMPQHAVLENFVQVAAHHETWCEVDYSCRSPPPECPPPPELPELGERILYMLASGSGCSRSVRIDAVLDCGNRIEVHYGFGGIIGCDAFGYAWASVAIPCGPAPVVFIPS